MMKAARKTLQEERIDSDVLVVGAGAGGLMAAITAADGGAQVVLCEKGNTRRSGGITGGNDHFFCYIPEIHGKAVRENYIRENMNGRLVDEDIVTNQVDRAYDVLQKWENWGVNLKTNGHYEFTGHSWPGSSARWENGKDKPLPIHFSDEKLCVKLENRQKIKVYAL